MNGDYAVRSPVGSASRSPLYGFRFSLEKDKESSFSRPKYFHDDDFVVNFDQASYDDNTKFPYGNPWPCWVSH